MSGIKRPHYYYFLILLLSLSLLLVLLILLLLLLYISNEEIVSLVLLETKVGTLYKQHQLSPN